MLGQHICCRLKTDANIAETLERRRLVAATVLEQGRAFDLLGFGLADTHMQMVTASDGGAELARRVEISLSARFKGPGFMTVDVRPVEKQWHLYNALTYDLRQVVHHRVHAVDPYFEGTNLPDLLGLRLTGRYTRELVLRKLPRLPDEDLLQILGLTCLEPADGPLERVVEAGAAAICLPRRTLTGRSVQVIRARRAVIEVVGSRLSTTLIAPLLGVNRTTINRLRKEPASQLYVDAIRLQLGLWRAKPVSAGPDR